MANQKSNEFRANLKTRQTRRNDQADYLKEVRCPSDIEQQKECEAMAKTFDITEFGGWFLENNSKIRTKNLRFNDCDAWLQSVQSNPKIWFQFFAYLQSLILWSDQEINASEEISGDGEEKYQYLVNQSKDKCDRYPQDILSNQKETDKVRNENLKLQQRVKEQSSKAPVEDKISSDLDSDKEFFRELTPKRVSFPRDSARNTKSPKLDPDNCLQSSSNNAITKLIPLMTHARNMKSG